MLNWIKFNKISIDIVALNNFGILFHIILLLNDLLAIQISFFWNYFKFITAYGNGLFKCIR